jgi:hypothetical protein
MLERQNISAKVLPFRQWVMVVHNRRSLTCGYENIAFQAKTPNNLFCKKK